MTATMSWLPRVLRWVFRAFTIVLAIIAVALVIVLIADPKLPANTTLGTTKIELLGLPGTVYLENSQLGAQLVQGGVTMRVNDAAGLFEVVKHAGLPVTLLHIAYLILLFDLMRRLFRNVARGESFTRPTLRLVQWIGFSLLVFSLVAAVAEGWLVNAVSNFMAQHAAVAVSGMAVHLPQVQEFHLGDNTGFGDSYFFTGLLVLALSEVFRQGLALKSDNDLTI